MATVCKTFKSFSVLIKKSITWLELVYLLYSASPCIIKMSVLKKQSEFLQITKKTEWDPASTLALRLVWWYKTKCNIRYSRVYVTGMCCFYVNRFISYVNCVLSGFYRAWCVCELVEGFVLVCYTYGFWIRQLYFVFMLKCRVAIKSTSLLFIRHA